MQPRRNTPEKITAIGRLKRTLLLPPALLFLGVAVGLFFDRALGSAFIGLVLGGSLLWPALRGWQQIRLARAYPAYYDALMNAGELSVKELEGELSKPGREIRQDLQGMSHLKLIPPLRFDPDGKILFIDTTGTYGRRGHANSFPATCANCGAPGTSVDGQHNVCRYCGSTLNPPWAR